jgi:hypothetical protein
MNGSMRLSLQREPDYFAAVATGNLETQVIVGREAASGCVVSTATRGIRRAYVDGSERLVGYLSSLRVQETARHTTLLARGYRYLKALHQDGRVPYYVTTILKGNDEARALLTSGRAGLPTYLPMGTMHTYLLPLYERGRHGGAGPVTRASKESVRAALACVNGFHANLQFAPAYRAGDLDSASPVLHGLAHDDVYIYRCGAEVAGTLALWDQNAFKQSVVAGYSPGLTALRPMLAVAAKFGWAPQLPAPGHSLPCLFAALMSSRDDDAQVFQDLLHTAMAERSNTGYAYLLVGLCDRHPFCRVVEKLSVMTIASEIYLVYWDDCRPESLPSRDRMPHLEVATL